MSDRHPKRSRCVICGLLTRLKTTFAYLLVHERNTVYLEPGRAQLCGPCREAWWLPMQLPLWPELEVQDDTLPAEAPQWDDRPSPLASWPPGTTRAWVNRRLSVLVGSDPA